MATLLHIDASARAARSLTRRLSRLFVDEWVRLRPDDGVRRRDLGLEPPPHVTEAWIAAAFTPPAERTPARRAALAPSDAYVAEVKAADLLVLVAPMYNYGMPSALKAWVDQVARVGETFSFDLARGDFPIAPTLSGKRLVVLSARGEFGFRPGGARERSNHFDPHLAACAHYFGVAPRDVHLVDVEYQEFGDGRFARSLTEAEARAVALARELAALHPSAGGG